MLLSMLTRFFILYVVWIILNGITDKIVVICALVW